MEDGVSPQADYAQGGQDLAGFWDELKSRLRLDLVEIPSRTKSITEACAIARKLE